MKLIYLSPLLPLVLAQPQIITDGRPTPATPSTGMASSPTKNMIPATPMSSMMTSMKTPSIIPTSSVRTAGRPPKPMKTKPKQACKGDLGSHAELEACVRSMFMNMNMMMRGRAPKSMVKGIMKDMMKMKGGMKGKGSPSGSYSSYSGSYSSSKGSGTWSDSDGSSSTWSKSGSYSETDSWSTASSYSYSSQSGSSPSVPTIDQAMMDLCAVLKFATNEITVNDALAQMTADHQAALMLEYAGNFPDDLCEGVDLESSSTMDSDSMESGSVASSIEVTLPPTPSAMSEVVQ